MDPLEPRDLWSSVVCDPTKHTFAIQSSQSTFPPQNIILSWSMGGTVLGSAELHYPEAQGHIPDTVEGLLLLNYAKSTHPPAPPEAIR